MTTDQDRLKPSIPRPVRLPPGRSRGGWLTTTDTLGVPMSSAEFQRELWPGRELQCNWRSRDTASGLDAPKGLLKRQVSRVTTTTVFLRSNDTESYLLLPNARNNVKVYRVESGFMYVEGAVRIRYRWE